MYGRPWQIVKMASHRKTGKPGLMCVAELAKLAPDGFFPEGGAPRIYWIHNDTADWSLRGGHFHPTGGKCELIVALSGMLKFDLHSAFGCGLVTLEDPGTGLLIPNELWHAVQVSPGGLLLSIASTPYSPDESVETKPCDCKP